MQDAQHIKIQIHTNCKIGLPCYNEPVWVGLKWMMPWVSWDDMDIRGCEEKHSSAAMEGGAQWPQAAVAVVATSTASTAYHISMSSSR